MESRTVPTSVKVFGILHTVFGALTLALSPLNIANLNTSLDALESLGVSPVTLNWTRVSTYLAPILAIILLVLGIGLLRKQPWARSGAVIFAYVSIALAVIGGILTAIGFLGLNNSNNSAGGAVVVGALVGGVVGTVLSCIYPILTAIFMNKPNVKAALDRRA